MALTAPGQHHRPEPHQQEQQQQQEQYLQQEQHQEEQQEQSLQQEEHQQEQQQEQPRRKRRLVVHIGPHKTGTSYFQMLAQQKGLSPTLQWPSACGKHVVAKGFADFAKHVCRPEKPKNGLNAARNGNNGKAPRIFWALPAQGCEAQSRRYLDSIKKSGESEGADLLISAEDFSLCGHDGFLRLRRLFEPEFQLEVLVVRRDSRSLQLSRYRESHRYRPVTSNLTESLPQLRSLAGLCSYAGHECLGALADVFGGEHVHVVSYEGLRAAKTDLFHESCRLLSRHPGGCFQERPQKASSGLFYKSEPYARYSATVIFNRLAAELRCSTGSGSGSNRALAAVSQGSNLVDAFMGDLKRAGVKKRCRPLADIVSPVEACEEPCVAKAIADGTFPVRGYMFPSVEQQQHEQQHRRQLKRQQLKEAAVEAAGELCHYDEASVLGGSDEELRAEVAEAVKRLSGCSS